MPVPTPKTGPSYQQNTTMSDTATPPAKKNRTLSHEQYYLLREWTKDNADLVADFTNADHAATATRSLGFDVSPSTISDLRQILGITRPEPEKDPELAELVDQIFALRERVVRLESMTLPPHLRGTTAIATGIHACAASELPDIDPEPSLSLD